MSATVPIPEVGPGVLLTLDGDDWSEGRGLVPGSRVEVVLSGLHPDDSDEWVWVAGHRPGCAYPHVDEHVPCLELRVRLAVLRRYGSARHEP
ncbi:hypothetical protein OG777_02190 [Micromonospora peucetia]|uniref:Uncharacterized protein n=1 Tax=Micromonospora peucetia TaxID=47871 RepID=A0ABZ1EHH8_9ACTN|nr:hypothetical protein [Micromonospora peucetia]MCX4385739.1 hypothetical protein [Micromonospora peucetia]WSA33116.1 hypothetical protein OIE14_03295 [Micromonospora peucetia]